ncbi:MAG: glycosyltransferase family 4 protein [Egibacteraceae bacterium]
MRILHVNKFLYRRGGAEAYMEDVAALQRGAAHEVAFFGMAHPANGAQRFAEHFPPHLQLDPPPPTLAGRARAMGRMLWSAAAARGIAAVIEAFRPDVAHLHNVYHQLSPSILGPLARWRIPTVMTLHDYKLACPSYLFMAGGQVCEACLGGHFHQALRRRCKDGSLAASGALALESALHAATGAYGRVGVFICPSRFMAAKMTQAGVFPERMRCSPHFIDLSTIEGAEAAGQGAVFAGRLSPEKGVDTLIEAVARMGSGSLEIAGDGPERTRLMALAQARAPGRVRFHGHLPKADLHELIRSAAVAVLPSRCYENQPLIVLEAFACGVPVICSDLGGMPELVDPGVDGLLVPPNDPDALAAALRRFFNDPEGAFAMGRAARAKVEEQFSPDRHLCRLDEIYAEAAAHVR